MGKKKSQQSPRKFETESGIEFIERNDLSKALPLYKIPKLIFNFLINFFEFRKQLKKIKLTMI